MKILLVDDDVELSKILGTRLARRSLEVEHANSLAEAISIFDARLGDFTAILCDYHIGHDTGLQFFDHVSAKTFSGRFVMMSGEEMPCERLVSLTKSGQCHQVLKPFDLNTLVDLIKG